MCQATVKLLEWIYTRISFSVLSFGLFSPAIAMELSVVLKTHYFQTQRFILGNFRKRYFPTWMRRYFVVSVLKVVFQQTLSKPPLEANLALTVQQPMMIIIFTFKFSRLILGSMCFSCFRRELISCNVLQKMQMQKYSDVMVHFTC